jgi:crossover junction endodeoxyribonuclease RusA
VRTFALTVPGKPLPKGSLRHVGKGRLVEQTKVKTWMQEIRNHTVETYGSEIPLFEAPVQAVLKFRFPRPASAKNRLYPHLRSAGDIDKLTRAVLDALQPAVLLDDSLVVELTASKSYALTDDDAGVSISIKELT